MPSRRPKHGPTEATGQAAIAVLQREPDERNDDVHVEGDAGIAGRDDRRLPPGGWIDNLPPLRAQLSGVLAEFVA